MKTKHKLEKKYIMKHYFSLEELRDMLKIPLKKRLEWLVEANEFINKAVPRKLREIQDKLILESKR